MPQKNEFPLKEKYRLWWEYLSRSKSYRDFCDVVRVEGKFSNEKTIKKYFEINGDYQLLTPEQKKLIDPLFRIHGFFGDIYKMSFDQWWEGNFSQYEKIKRVLEVTDKIDELWSYFYIKESHPLRKPSVEINNGWVFNELMPLNGCVIRIDYVQNWKMENLVKEVRKIVANFKKQPLKHGPLSLTEPLRFCQLKRYLEIYDHVSALKEQKKSWKNIFANFHPEIEKKLSDETLSITQHDRLLVRKESLQRTLHLEFSNAKKIIKNVENGLFPGKY